MDRDELSERPQARPNLSSCPNLPSLCEPPAGSVYAELRTVEGEVDGSGVWFPLGKMLELPAPMMTMIPALDPLYTPPGLMLPSGQGLSLPYEWYANPFDSQLGEEPAMMMMMMQPGAESLTTTGHVNRNIPPRSALPCAAASSNSSAALRGAEGEEQRDGKKKGGGYIKKPLNAFMLFRQEQRPKVVALLNIRNSADVNKVVGQMWKSLSKKQQRKYYELADAAKLLHSQQHPDWSCTENYGKKRKRQRVKVHGKGQEDTWQASSPDVTSDATHAIKQESHHRGAKHQKQLRVMLELML